MVTCPFCPIGSKASLRAILGPGRQCFSAKQPIFFRLFLVLIRVNSWFFLDDLSLTLSEPFLFGRLGKLDFALGFCC